VRAVEGAGRGGATCCAPNTIPGGGPSLLALEGGGALVQQVGAPVLS